jgi:hypothetical protein
MFDCIVVELYFFDNQSFVVFFMLKKRINLLVET